MCAPNDVWSLGVILVNLTCGRNPWKQASVQDSTYRAFSRSPDFLKTILPVTDDLNDILGRIFHANPDNRITLSELRERILACNRLTVPTAAAMSVPPSPPATPEHVAPQYVIPSQDAMVDFDNGSPLSPVSTFSDEGSLTSSGSTIDDLDEDFIREQQNGVAPECTPYTYEPEVPKEHPVYHGQEFIPQHYTGPIPTMAVLQPQPQAIHCPQPLPIQAPCAPKTYCPFWDVVKYVQQVPLVQHTGVFHHQVPVMPSFQGCF